MTRPYVSKAPPGKPLNLMQQRFVHEYLVDEVATAAARRAGYSGKRARWQACDLMNNPRVKAAIAAAKAARDAPWTREMVIEQLRKIASANVLDYARPGADGALELDLWRLERDRAGAVKALSVVEKTDPKSGVVTRTVGFTLADRSAALIKLLPMLESGQVTKAMDRGYAFGVESILELDLGEFARMKAYWAERARETGYRQVKSGAELAWRQHQFWRRDRRVEEVADWEPATDEDLDGLNGDPAAAGARSG
ncbi:terminase small subunit [Caulobacter sp. NIBR1757]|uniref:terminase small subunit n=1 Tax=Caulobacter sp. NIBR1757 TaxID=3016000 RepID=UPI0022F02E19|nr:terminase small subunit [Caulobacter sp. NIBR1757]WGM38567.1 hypothetical protein AMEJIAPC_01470 [Caulobacter sp. NIBR1757]